MGAPRTVKRDKKKGAFDMNNLTIAEPVEDTMAWYFLIDLFGHGAGMVKRTVENEPLGTELVELGWPIVADVAGPYDAPDPVWSIDLDHPNWKNWSRQQYDRVLGLYRRIYSMAH